MAIYFLLYWANMNLKFRDFANVKDFMKEVDALGYRNPFNDMEVVVDDKCSIGVQVSSDTVHIDTLRCFSPKSGHGTEIMTRIINLADKYKVNLSLYPVPLKTKVQISQKKLIEFYKRFGFVGTKALMTRKHKEDVLKIGNQNKVLKMNPDGETE